MTLADPWFRCISFIRALQCWIRLAPQGFSFKDHGDDIGTDMSEEKGPSKKDGTEETAVPFDPSKAAKAIAAGKPVKQGNVFVEYNLYDINRPLPAEGWGT
ncbi:unnamed protein product [Strongylus vulgaris]|uniref:Uncharacterized protein n=1 Tax=Strongylus vulgaris TaxID=40348 RepID=A0A3P7JA63_STRVU|nr:unnamed protein product [Strongylus vulgaris]